jgi:D-alanyl-D-alanine carboxypeptidase
MVLSVEKYPELAWQPKQLVAIGSSTGLLFTPGTEFLYSNTNFVLLTMIAKQASGKSLGQLLRAKVIEPLGLDDTTYKPGVKDIPSPFVSGYTIESGDGPRDATFTSPTIAFGAGAVVSTQRDVRRFFSSLIAGRLLPEPWLRKMQASTPQSFAAGDPYYGYGLGLEETIRDCGTTYGHAGGFPGYMSHTDVTPDARGSFTIYTNSSPKIGSTAPFPPEILANLEHAKDVLRCAIQAR